MELTGILTTVQVGGRGDAALDRDHPDLTDAVAQHARARDADSLARLRACARPGRRLHEYELTPLSPGAMAFLASQADLSLRAILAFRAACVAVVDAQGVRHEARLTAGTNGKGDGSFGLAPFEWYERWTTARGLAAVQEIGAVAFRRGEVGPEDTDFYWPLAGVPRLAA